MRRCFTFEMVASVEPVVIHYVLFRLTDFGRISTEKNCWTSSTITQLYEIQWKSSSVKNRWNAPKWEHIWFTVVDDGGTPNRVSRLMTFILPSACIVHWMRFFLSDSTIITCELVTFQKIWPLVAFMLKVVRLPVACRAIKIYCCASLNSAHKRTPTSELMLGLIL